MSKPSVFRIIGPGNETMGWFDVPPDFEEKKLIDGWRYEYAYPPQQPSEAVAGRVSPEHWIAIGRAQALVEFTEQRATARREQLAALAIDIGKLRELVAKAIYSQWTFMPGWVEWVENGNSIRQDDARQLAQAHIDASGINAALIGETKP